jgi:RNA polymerase sigma-70 factor (ECF subfamily)
MFAVGFVKDAEAAREIVQEVFVNLWEKRETIDRSKQVKSYLAASVRNRCLNHLRNNRKFSPSLLELQGLSDEAEAAGDRLVERELSEAIAEAIAGLPDRCREIFLLNRNHHLRYQQIADHLQISVKTVETQMSKALQHLRVRLAGFLTLLLLVVAEIPYLWVLIRLLK